MSRYKGNIKIYMYSELNLPQLKIPIMNEMSPFVSDEVPDTPEKQEIDIYEPTGELFGFNNPFRKTKYEYKYVGTRIE